MVLVLTSAHHGLHALLHVELAFNHELFQTPVPSNLDSKVKRAQHLPVSMDHGLLGLLVRQHVVAVSNKDVAIIAAEKHLMSKSDHALFQLDHGVHGLNGPSARYHAGVPVLYALDFIRVLVKSILIPNSVTLIHVLIMVLGLTGHHALLHVVWEQ